ncbi:hypothetical protein MNB_ARC-1_1324 [hydrothermal vent metagenome]|uniref:Toxin-antitoxin protein n=1 Tax=hydrothermal vent metagenome TaxID=652676 RepID=A0A3B1DU27_9ZZZZ
MKEFDEWNEIKKDISKTPQKFFIKQREIYWIYLGENIGFEQNGKGDEFLRPVLVYKKFSANLFYGIPLTTNVKNSKFYFHFKVKNRDNCAILSQMRLFDTKRIHDNLGKISVDDFAKLKDKLGILLDFTPTKKVGFLNESGNLEDNYNKNSLKSKELKDD